MWDNAAALCFVTNTKAKQEKLKGSKVELSVIKVGAQSEKIKTNKYKVPLIDELGHVIEFEAYGIERITSDIGKHRRHSTSFQERHKRTSTFYHVAKRQEVP